MKIALISEKQTSRVTFNYIELTNREKELVIAGLRCYKKDDNDMRAYNDPQRMTEAKEIDELLANIRKEN